MKRDHYLGWRNFVRPEHMERDEADRRGRAKSNQIRRQVQADVQRLEAIQAQQRASGMRCRDRGCEVES